MSIPALRRLFPGTKKASPLQQGLAYCIGTVLYNLYLHPLRHFPGPRLSAMTRVPYTLSQLSGQHPRRPGHPRRPAPGLNGRDPGPPQGRQGREPAGPRRHGGGWSRRSWARDPVVMVRDGADDPGRGPAASTPGCGGSWRPGSRTRPWWSRRTCSAGTPTSCTRCCDRKKAARGDELVQLVWHSDDFVCPRLDHFGRIDKDAQSS